MSDDESGLNPTEMEAVKETLHQLQYVVSNLVGFEGEFQIKVWGANNQSHLVTVKARMEPHDDPRLGRVVGRVESA